MSPNPERASTSPLGPLPRNISTAVGSVVKRWWSMKRSLMRWLARPSFVVSIGAACLRLTAQDVTVRPWSTSSKSNSPPKGRLLDKSDQVCDGVRGECSGHAGKLREEIGPSVRDAQHHK